MFRRKLILTSSEYVIRRQQILRKLWYLEGMKNLIQLLMELSISEQYFPSAPASLHDLTSYKNLILKISCDSNPVPA
jgi:hypothetical protein